MSLPRYIGAYALAAAAVVAAPFERLLDLPSDYTSHRVSRLDAIPSGETQTLLDIEGPGAITHLWMTLGQHDPRGVVLRMYWDDETAPSVEAPIADFFGVGHGQLEPELYFGTPCLAVAPKNGYNAYFPMPFRKHARVTVANENGETLSDGGGVYFQADYMAFAALPETTPYFHAQWRREAPAQRRGAPYTILKALGEGFVAGVTLHVRTLDRSDRWFHGGGDMLFIDGRTAPEIIKGIGGEDFFGESWSSALFAGPNAGCTSQRNGEVSMYRFFLEGPPRFSESVRVTYGALENEMTSVAYWYQRGPHAAFTVLPPREQRDPRSTIKPGEFDLGFAARPPLEVALVGPFEGDIETKTPLDGMHPIDTSVALATNYSRPYKNIFPDPENRRVQWERAATDLHWLDLEAIYEPKMPFAGGVQFMPNAIAYVLIRVNASDARAAILNVGHDDAVKVWLNGAVAADLAERSGFGRDPIELNLRKGPNEVLLKVANAWNTNFAAFALALSFEKIEGLSFDEFAGLTPALSGI